jgi:hypothetical protein
MNKERRKRIADAIVAISKIESLIQNILDDEQEAYENMPEGVKISENGMVSEEAQDNLDSAIEALEEAISCLEEI